MAGKIFISYRRDDVRADARDIAGRLSRAFGERNVFMDVDNLLAGQRFDQELETALAQCDVFIAVIGNQRANLLAERQAANERDIVVDEIADANRMRHRVWYRRCLRQGTIATWIMSVFSPKSYELFAGARSELS